MAPPHVRSRIAEHLRRKRPERKRLEAPADSVPGTGLIESLPDPAPDHLDALWETEWKQNLMEAALARVSKKVSARQYLIYDLFALKQVPLRKVTESLQINAAQVYLAKHRVGRLVRQELQRLDRQAGE